MNTSIKNILQNNDFSKDDIIELLYTNQSEAKLLYQKAKEVKIMSVGDKVFLRGLIEFSKFVCKRLFLLWDKKSNKNVERYFLSDDEIIQQRNLLLTRIWFNCIAVG
jgi:biotin synthase